MFPPFMVTLVCSIFWNGWYYVLVLPALVFLLKIPTLPKSWVDAVKNYCLTPTKYPSFPGEIDPDVTSSAVKLVFVGCDTALFLLTQLCLLFEPTWIAPSVCSVGLAIVAPYLTLDGEVMAKEHNTTLTANSR
ncbi:hypothetical protein THRCLA_23050 [Thraustotheca clavata]|uniref:Uncharacterized protein n=1 Tax=Thraustotheca clavata TaxID=74557 RepID=A0A1V9YHK3_9STRA|nr:hypothetical protein THRCLA_23050 [Thraustotheca clavata]